MTNKTMSVVVCASRSVCRLAASSALALTVLSLAFPAHAQVNPITVSATNGLSCAGTRSGGTGSGCTAKDFTTIVSFSNPSVANCVHGQPVTLSFVASIISNNAPRDDLGFFIGEQGNDPQVNDASMTCSVTTFPTTPAPWFDDVTNSNACGDFAKNSQSDATISNVKVTCGPTAGQPLQVPYVLTYSISNTACTGAGDVNASPNSKCQGGAGVNAVGVTGTTVIPAADLSMFKSPSFNSATGVMTYTLLISNAGPDAADGATYSDTLPGSISAISASCGGESNGAVCADPDVSGNDVTGTVPTLPATGSVTITITGTVAGGTPSESNTASVSPPNGVADPNPGNDSSTANISTPVTLQSFDVI